MPEGSQLQAFHSLNVLEGSLRQWELSSPSEQFFVGVELPELAGVVQRNVGVGALFALVDLANIERFGIDVDTDGALFELRTIQYLVHRFERIHIGRVSGV